VPAPAAGAADGVSGRLLFDGKPFVSAAAPPPRFWFRDEARRTEVKPELEYADGTFILRGLAPGRYAMSVRIDLAPQNPNTYPGDLTGWEEFAVEPGRATQIEVALRTLMRLVQPFDNGALMPGWDAPCGAGHPSPGKLLFSWEPLEPGTRYDVSIDRLACGRGYAPAGRVFTRSTTDAWVNVDLPQNRDGECYSLRLTANRGGRTVGIMNTHGKSGIGWDLRFAVVR
jgi:hypothetical protein